MTYRGVIHATLDISTGELVRLLQEWVASGASVSFQAQLLSTDRNCAAVSIPSLNDDECGMVDVPATVVATLQSSSSLSVGIIGAVVGVVLVVVIAATIVVVVVVVVVCKMKRRTLSESVTCPGREELPNE